MSHDKRIRVLLAKPGLDGHDQGAKRVRPLFAVFLVGRSAP
jgi:methylmalonyl-CoA mutase cobalamin-binding domain/chain